MTIKNLSNQVIALAGAYQACQQVKSVAWQGRCESDVLDTAVGSVFKVNAASLDAVYDGQGNIRHGLQILAHELDSRTARPDSELTRYVLNLSSIERKLTRQPNIAATIRQAIAGATTQLQHFGSQHPNTLAALADIYQRTISQLKPRVMVNGERIHLSNENNVTKIRTLLLAGLRSMVLWRQCGGTRLGFIIRRRHYFHEANSLLAANPEPRSSS
ncbi:MAG: high frequency lysogenization protein HflD [Gammaproteobacteria bacterium]|nr:high frequency lysogenization protein HflD [Gammaproteobacteria bacterium]